MIEGMRGNAESPTIKGVRQQVLAALPSILPIRLSYGLPFALITIIHRLGWPF
jgi:hypothetical protein